MATNFAMTLTVPPGIVRETAGWRASTTVAGLLQTPASAGEVEVDSVIAAHPARRIRSTFATTPGRLRLASLAILVALAVAWLVAATTVRARQAATHRVGLETEPLLVGAQDIYASLADADATEANAFLTGGLEPANLRARYDADVKRAGDRLADITRQIGTSASALAAAQTMTEQIPVYTGLVEAARANNRQLFPVGAAYLREASKLMRGEILPAADGLYQVENQRLDQSYRSGASAWDVAGVLAGGAILLAVLFVTQLYLTRRTNRVFNLPMLAATVAAAGLLVWVVATFTSQHRHLAQAQRTGSDPVKVLAQARILALNAGTDEALALVGRGGDQKYLSDFKVTVAKLGGDDGSSGLLGQATKDTPGGTVEILSAYRAFIATHADVQKQAAGGEFAAAIMTATTKEFGPPDSKLAKLDAAISNTVNDNQQRFASAAASARHAFSGIAFGVTVLALAIGLLAVFGAQQRINDYR